MSDLPARVGRLEGEMADVGKTVVRLETNQAHIMTKQDRVLSKIDEVKNVANGSAEGVTFKWLLEKIALPLIVSGASAGAAIYAAVRVLTNGP